MPIENFHVFLPTIPSVCSNQFTASRILIMTLHRRLKQLLDILYLLLVPASEFCALHETQHSVFEDICGVPLEILLTNI